MTEHDIRRAAALSKIIREIPKQLEAIAAEWEMSGHGRRDAHAEDEAQVYYACARELREYVATWKRAGEEP